MPGSVERSVSSPSRSDVKVIGEGGMMGIAVDPNFASNRFIYTCFHSSLSTPATTRVVRWKVDSGLHGPQRPNRPDHRHPGVVDVPFRLPHAIRSGRLPVDHHR